MQFIPQPMINWYNVTKNQNYTRVEEICHVRISISLCERERESKRDAITHEIYEKCQMFRPFVHALVQKYINKTLCWNR